MEPLAAAAAYGNGTADYEVLYSGVEFLDKQLCPTNLTYGDRIAITYDLYTVCTVSESAFDGLLVAILGVILYGLVSSRPLAAMWLFVSGFAISALAFSFPVSILSNGIGQWINIAPGDLLVYVFLPALLLDESVRLEFHVFKRCLTQSLLLASLAAFLATALLVLFMLYGLRLGELYGWTATHASLFASVIVATDPVSVSAILDRAGAPQSLDYILRGESLFNDGTSLVMFNIFLSLTSDIYEGDAEVEVTLASLGAIFLDICGVAASATLLGLGAGVLHSAMLKLIKRSPWTPEAELTFTLAVGYLLFYVCQAPYILDSSGAIAVVVFGIFGSWTERFGLSGKLRVSGQFDAVYGSIMFMINGIVFVYAGMSSFTFIIISIDMLGEELVQSLTYSVWMGFIIYLMAFVFRFFAVGFCEPILRATGSGLGSTGVTFASVAGLRGALSLMLLRCVIYTPWKNKDGTFNDQAQLIQAQMVIWGTMFVLLTLVINAPLLSHLLRWLELDRTDPGTLNFQETVKGMYEQAAAQSFADLQTSMTESNGNRVDWELVQRLQDVSQEINPKDLDPEYPRWHHRALLRFQRCLRSWCFCCGAEGDDDHSDGGSVRSSEDLESVAHPWGAYSNILCATFLPNFVRNGITSPTDSPREPLMTPAESRARGANKSFSQSRAGQMFAVGPTPTFVGNANKATLVKDARIRVLAAVKQHFYETFAAGHITLPTLQVLSGACDSAICSSDAPLGMCRALKEAGKHDLRVRVAEGFLHVLWKFTDCFGPGYSAVYMPFVILRAQGLLLYEAAVAAYAVSLACVKADSFPRTLQREIARERERARAFLRDRELESPGLYYAALTQRAATAMLSERLTIVRRLSEMGLMSEGEARYLSRPVEMRLLEINNHGACYQAPPPMKALASLPFLKCLPGDERAALLQLTRRHVYEPGQIVWQPPPSTADGNHSVSSSAPSPAMGSSSSSAYGRFGAVARPEVRGREISHEEMLLVCYGVVQTLPWEEDDEGPSPAAVGTEVGEEGSEDDSSGEGIYYWGAGGVIGLLSALHAADPTGDVFGRRGGLQRVGVPRRTAGHVFQSPEARAFGLPREAFHEIRRRASEGDAAMKQSELEAFRLAAILELHSGSRHMQTLRAELSSYLAGSDDGSDSEAHAEQAEIAAPPRLSMGAQAALPAPRHAHIAADVDELLRATVDQIKSARLLRLGAGEAVGHTSNIVLLGGALFIGDESGGQGGPRGESVSVLLHFGGAAVASLAAGDSGALLLVCPSGVLPPPRQGRAPSPDAAMLAGKRKERMAAAAAAASTKKKTTAGVPFPGDDAKDGEAPEGGSPSGAITAPAT